MHTLRRYNVIHMEINIHDMKYGCGFLQRIGDMNVVSLQLVETNEVQSLSGAADCHITEKQRKEIKRTFINWRGSVRLFFLGRLAVIPILSDAHSTFEDNKTEAASPLLHYFSAILTAKLIFQFLLCDIWLTEQRCRGQLSPREEAERNGVAEWGGCIEGKEGKREKKCHIHPYHSGLQFPKRHFSYGSGGCILTVMVCLCSESFPAIHTLLAVCRRAPPHHRTPSKALKSPPQHRQ